MRAPGGLHPDYVSLAEYQAAGWPDVLGVARFNASAAMADSEAPAEIPLVQVSTPVLTATTEVYEVWRGGEQAESGQHDRVRFRRTADTLFGCIALSEGESSLHQATTQAYRQICATLDAQSYPYLLRVWNYVPDINGDTQGSERYWQFNSARRHALRACGWPLSGNVPAASALGAAPDSPLVVYFLAARTAPTFVENPRQMSAYHYPRQYGPHSPVFSRATLLRQPRCLTLFISGTASIVGHRSLHVGDTAAQTRETLANIEALLEEANRVSGGAQFRLGALDCKVYVRRPADLPLIQTELKAALGAGARAVYLHADICRQDLLVEIEATGMYPLAAVA